LIPVQTVGRIQDWTILLGMAPVYIKQGGLGHKRPGEISEKDLLVAALKKLTKLVVYKSRIRQTVVGKNPRRNAKRASKKSPSGLLPGQ